jgi:hypothetical protein
VGEKAARSCARDKTLWADSNKILESTTLLVCAASRSLVSPNKDKLSAEVGARFKLCNALNEANRNNLEACQF